MGNILYVFNFVGALASSLLALITVTGIIIAKSKAGKEKIKQMVKESLGIIEIQNKLESLRCVQVHGKIELQSKALLSLIRKDLLQLCKHCLCENKVTIPEREVIIESYKVYRDLGGNHFVSDLVETVLELPIDSTSKL